MRQCNERLLVTRCKKKIIITIMAFLSLERYFCIGLFYGFDVNTKAYG